MEQMEHNGTILLYSRHSFLDDAKEIPSLPTLVNPAHIDLASCEVAINFSILLKYLVFFTETFPTTTVLVLFVCHTRTHPGPCFKGQEEKADLHR